MGCSMCGVSCDSPCAIICYSDLFGVLGGCAGHGRKIVVDIKSDVLKSGRELKFTESTEVRFSCNEMPVDRLLAFLKLAHPEGRISKPAAEAKT